MAPVRPVQEEPSTSTTPGQTPHVKIASFTLPHGVKGEVKGELVVCIESLHWNYRKPPQQVQVRLKWWGGTADTVVPFHSTRGAGAAFPVTCGPRYLSRYLKDMGHLVVNVEECPSGRAVGTISIAVSQLDMGKPIEASVPCYGTQKQLLATADVSMRVHYTQLLSSFEINEHLASTDRQLPLYPVAGAQGDRQKQRQTTAGQHKIPHTPSTAGGKENTAEVSITSELRNGATREGSSQLQQQPHTVRSASDPAVTTATAACGPMQQQAQSLSLVPATAAAGHAMTATTGPEPEALLEIIHRAEQLKFAMEQATSRGISLGLPCGLAGPVGILAQSVSNLAGPVSSLAGFSSTPAGLQLWPQQQLAWPHSNKQAPGVLRRWPPGTAALASAAAASTDAPGAIAASPAAVEAVQACLYGSPAAFNSPLALPQAAAAAAAAATSAAPHGQLATLTAVPVSGLVATSADISLKHQQLSPLAAALLHLPAQVETSREHASSEDGDEASGSSSSSTSSDSSQVTELEDLEELEELLLQELFRVGRSPKHSPLKSKQQSSQQQQQQAGHLLTSLPSVPVSSAAAEAEAASREHLPDTVVVTSNNASSAETDGTYRQPVTRAAADGAREQAASKPTGPQLAVTITGVECSGAAANLAPKSVTAVIKCGGQNKQVDITQLLQQQGSGSSSIDSGGVTAVVNGPRGLLEPVLATDSLGLVVELWSGQPPSSAGAANAAAGQLLGIVKVPLDAAAAAAGGAAEVGVERPCLAQGTYPVYDVLRGRYAGSATLGVCLAANSPDADEQGSKSSPAAAAAAAVEAPCSGPSVLAVQHVINVTLHRATALPDQHDLESGGHASPETRFMKYSFPGEEALFTQEVDCVSSPVFSAHAQHTVMLPPGQSISECLLEGDANEHLLFEVYNKWPDDTDTLVASGTLPLSQVLELTQQNHPATTESSHSMKTFLVPLQLTPGAAEAAIQPLDRAVLLQVVISYSAENCYTLDYPTDAADHSCAGSDADGNGDHCESAAVDDERKDAVAAAVAAEEAWMSHQQDDEIEANVDLAAAPPAAPAAALSRMDDSPAQVIAENVARASDGIIESTRIEQAAISQQQQQPQPRICEEDHGSSVLMEDHCNEHTAAGPAAVLSGMEQSQADPIEDQAAATIASSQQQQREGLSAEICVEVIRACGLQAAVIEAERCLGGGSSLLGRARHLGPHPYVTIELPLNDNGKKPPAIKTPFQAQTFCPQFHYKQLIPLHLNANTVTGLATQDCNIELWHHCPRSQAVAIALSRGHNSSWLMEGQQQVQLGSARLSLQGVLVKPQGIQCWIVLKSQLGVPAGAVQVAVYFTHIGGQALMQCPADEAPAHRFPQLLQLLPPSPATAQLQGSLSSPAPGFQGQLAAVSIHIQELLLPSGDDVVLERPRIADYVATYKLPGRESEASTQSKANSSQRISSSLLAQSWHVDWQYCGRHWAKADWMLGKALVAYPLLITVYKQDTNRRSSSSSSGGSGKFGSRSDDQQQQRQVMVPVGSVEVDLSSLLYPRPGAPRSSCRWLSGVYVVVHPMAKNLGNTRIKIKVLLELQPADPPELDDVRSSAGFWEISGPLAAGAPAAAAGVLAAAAAAGVPAATAGVVEADAKQQQQQQLQPYTAQHASMGVPATVSDLQQRYVEDLRPVANPQQQQQQQQEEEEMISAARQSAQNTQTAGMPEPAPAVFRHTAAAIEQQVLTQRQAPAQQAEFSLAAASSILAHGEERSDTPPAAPSAAAVLAAAGLGGIQPVRRGRFKAEVFHVSAPASVAVSSSSSPGPAAAVAVQEQQHARMMRTQQRQQQHGVGQVWQHQTGAPGDTAAQQPLQQQQHWQQQQHGDELVLEQFTKQAPMSGVTLGPSQQWDEKPSPGHPHCQQQELIPALQKQQQQAPELTDVRVCIEAALNLDLPELPSNATAGLYVQYEWRSPADPAATDVISTPLVAAAVGPLRQTATAKWFHCVHLPLQLSNTEAAAAAESAEGVSEQLLVLEVWLRSVAADAAAALPPLYAGIAAAPAAGDVVLGVAVLDLAAIQVLGSIEGWYNICDEQQQLKGQIKVSLTPVQQQTMLRPRSQPEPWDIHQLQQQEQPRIPQLKQQAAWVTEDVAVVSPAVSPPWGCISHDSHAAVEPGKDRSGHDASQNLLQLPHLVQYACDAGDSTAPAPDRSRSSCRPGAAGTQADAELQPRQPKQPMLCQRNAVEDAGGVIPVEGAVTDQLLESLWASLKELDDLSAALAERVRPQTPGTELEDNDSSTTIQAQSQQHQHHHKAHTPVQQQQQAQPAQQQEEQQEIQLQLHRPFTHSQPQQQQQQQRPTAQISLTAAPLTVYRPDLRPAVEVVSSACQHSSCGSSSPSGESPDTDILANPIGLPSTQETPLAAPAAAIMSDAAAAAARAAALRDVQTLSDDEDYFVSGAAVTDSDADTEELMGRLDWNMAQNSDDYDVPAGPPHSGLATTQPPAAPAAADSASTPAALNKEDWMFDFSRPTGSTAAAAAGSSSSGPVNPAQLSQAAAATQQAAAAERLARVAEANAAAAAAKAAAAERAAAHAAADQAAAAAAAGDATAAAAGSNDVWEHLAAVEEQEEQQQQQQRWSQQQQPEVHDPRELPEVLEQRLDLLLANFQSSFNPAAANRTPAAAAEGDQAVQGLSYHLSDPGDDDDDGDFLPAERVVHQAESEGDTSALGFANCLPPIQDNFVLEFSDGPRRFAAVTDHTPTTAAAVGSQPTSAAATAATAAMWDRVEDDDLDDSAFVSAERVDHVTCKDSSSSRKVGFSNALPPVQDECELQYNDQRVAAPHVAQQQQQQQQRTPAAVVTAAVHTARRPVSHPGMEPAAAAAAAAAVEAATQADQAAAGAASAAMADSSRASGMVPVLGGFSTAAVDDMFSISKRPAANSGTSSRVRHPGHVNASARLDAAQKRQQQQQQESLAAAQSGSSSSCTAQPVAKDATASAAGSSTGVVPVLGRHTAAGLDDMFSISKRGSSTRTTSTGIRHPYM